MSSLWGVLYITDEINKLTDHLTSSFERSKGVNTLWKYFGFKSEAEPYKVAEGAEGKLEYITLQMDSLREKIDKLTAPSEKPKHIFYFEFNKELNILKKLKDEMESIIRNDNTHRQEKKLLALDSTFRERAQYILEHELTAMKKNTIVRMFEDIHELMKIYYQQKELD